MNFSDGKLRAEVSSEKSTLELTEAIRLRQHPDAVEGVVADRRYRGERRKLYREESVLVRVSTPQGTLEGTCLDISAGGLSLAVHNGKKMRVGEGSEVSVCVLAPQGQSVPIRGRVVGTAPFQAKDIGKSDLHVRVAFDHDEPDDYVLASLRGSPLFVLPAILAPMATSGDPLFSTGFIIYRVLGFTPRGAHLFAPGKEVHLLPGFRLQLRVLLPNADEISLSALILKVSQDVSEEGQNVHVVFESLSPDNQAAIAEYVLLVNESATVADLVTSGFLVEGTKRSFSVGYSNSESEWNTVLSLRLQAYHAAGKFQDRSSPVAMEDRFDSYSRQVICKSGRRIVGALRMVFVQMDRNRSEHVSLGIDVPPWLFEQPFLEVSRACTDSEFRGADVLPLLFRKGLEIAVQTGNKYIIANCNSDLWPMYKRIGFKKIDVRFTAFGRDDCELIVLDTQRLIQGFNVGFFTWNQMFLDSAINVAQNPSHHVRPLQRLISKGTAQIHKMLEKPILRIRRLKKLKKQNAAGKRAGR
jgi:Acetyltransferase (GNAT) domain/PilZ domain